MTLIATQVKPIPNMTKQTINLAHVFYTQRTTRKVFDVVNYAMNGDVLPYNRLALNELHDMENHIDLAVAGSSLAKRVSNWLFKNHQVRLPNELMQQIGEIAAEAKGFTCDVDVTDQFDWNDGDFGDAGSCFFGGREYCNARAIVLPRLRASALRFYRNDRGMGRVWVIPVPHRLTDGRDMYLLTNYYGDNVTPQRAALVLATLLGQTFGGEWTNKRVQAAIEGETFYMNPAAQMLVYQTAETTEDADSTPDAIRINSGDLDWKMTLPTWAINASYERDYDDYDDDDE